MVWKGRDQAKRKYDFPMTSLTACGRHFNTMYRAAAATATFDKSAGIDSASAGYLMMPMGNPYFTGERMEVEQLTTTTA